MNVIDSHNGDPGANRAFAYVAFGAAGLYGLYWLSEYLPQGVVLTALAVALPLLFVAARRYVREANKPPRRALVVLSNNAAGYDSAEARLAGDALEDAGLQVVWASPLGGAAPSVKDTEGVYGDHATLPLARCPARDFVAFYCVGGPGAVDLKSEALEQRAAQQLEADGVVGASGSGVVAFANLFSAEPDKALLIKGDELGKQAQGSTARIVVGESGDSTRAVVEAMAAALASVKPKAA